jgi:hypothetical protein
MAVLDTHLAWVASLQAAQEQLQWQGLVDSHRRGVAARDLSIRLMLDQRRDDAGPPSPGPVRLRSTRSGQQRPRG